MGLYSRGKNTNPIFALQISLMRPIRLLPTLVLGLFCVLNCLAFQTPTRSVKSIEPDSLARLAMVRERLPKLSSQARISLMTCARGTELYSSFGHSAFRLQDPVLGYDYVYNYGTFNFNTPNFYLKFTQGKLMYQLSRSTFEEFLFAYELEKRWVKQQILQLNQEQKQEFFVFLENNYLPENREYLYDYLFNNCSTITGDVLTSLYGDSLVFKDSHLEKRYTFRQLIRQNISYNSWSSFGIDLALGSVIDRKATVREHLFLPYYALSQIRNTELAGAPLLERERTVLDYEELSSSTAFFLSPLFWISVLMIVVLVYTYIDYKYQKRSQWVDFSVFSLTGLIGLVVVLLWFATDHRATAANLNVMWAFPLNLMAAYPLLKRSYVIEWVGWYLYLLLLGLLASLGVWAIGIQSFSPVLIPLWIALGVRYAFLLYRYYQEEY